MEVEKADGIRGWCEHCSVWLDSGEGWDIVDGDKSYLLCDACLKKVKSAVE